MDNSLIFLASLIIFCAFFVRSLSGFGSALVSIPFLALFFDLKFAVPLEALFEVLFSLILLPQVYKKISYRALAPLLIGAALGSLLGSYFLFSLNGNFLRKIFGLAVIAFALKLWLEQKTDKVQAISKFWGILAGGLGGILGGLFGTSGPPYVMYLSSCLKQKEVLRATLITLFALDYTWRAGLFALNGAYTWPMLTYVVYLTPAMVLGSILGHKTQVHLNEKIFQRLIALILGASGCLLLLA